MAEEVVARERAAEIDALAEAQHGVASAAQLYALGLSKDQVSDRVRAGWLHAIHRGVYAIGRRQLGIEGRLMAGVLARPGSAVSHRSAAYLWGILRGAPEATHVTVRTPGGRAQRPGLVVHRIATLRPDELTRRAGIPVTTPARTLLDIGPALAPRRLERAADEAERLGLCREEELEAIVAHHPRNHGAGALRRILRSHAVGSTVTRSELEERFLALCRHHRLPQPLVNAPLHDLTVDFLWAALRIVAEVDGHGSHGTRRAFQDDRDRDSLLAAHGFVTLRFTWWDVTRRPGVVANRLRRVLAGRTS